MPHSHSRPPPAGLRLYASKQHTPVACQTLALCARAGGCWPWLATCFTTPAGSEVLPRCAVPPQPPPAAPPAPRALARRICSPGYRILAPASLCVLAQQANLRPAAQRSGAKQCHAVRHGTRASHGTSTFCLRALTSARLRRPISPRTARAASRAAAPRPDQRMSHIICTRDRLAHISVGTDCGPRPSRARAP